MRLLRVLLLLVLAIPGPGQAAPSNAPKVATERATVAVIFALKSTREHQVPWQDGLTIDRAIQAAAGKRRATWNEAWRYRESFWTRNFRNPHSFWARVFAGERASGYTYFANAGENARSAALKPGDRIYVDLAPIQ